MQLAEYSHQHLLRASQRRQQAIEKIRQEYYMSTSSEATSQVYLFHRVQQIFISMGKQIARSSLYALYSRHEIPYSRSITRSSALSDALILTKVLNVVWFFSYHHHSDICSTRAAFEKIGIRSSCWQPHLHFFRPCTVSTVTAWSCATATTSVLWGGMRTSSTRW